MNTVREALFDGAVFLLIVLGALAVDLVLHWAGRPDWGRYLGYWGTLLVVLSFVHSARKRKVFRWGPASMFLRGHEFLAWLGAMMILVHGGTHFNGLLPWLAMAAMMVTVASGLVGKYLFKKSKIMVAEKKKALLEDNPTPAEVEELLYWDSLVVGLMRKWRAVHLPITMTFAFLALLHVVTVLAYWRW